MDDIDARWLVAACVGIGLILAACRLVTWIALNRKQNRKRNGDNR